MNIDPSWDNTTIAEKISEIIESIRLIPNRVTKTPPFEEHFGRPKNTELSKLLTNPNTNNLTYNNIKSFHLDKRLLQNLTLTPAAIWDRDTNSEVNLDIQYRKEDPARQDPQSEASQTSDSSESDNAPLMPSHKGTIIPSKFKYQIGDRTTIFDQTHLARKTIRRKNPEPRGTLKPLWSIIPDGTIADYTPHTISIDTHNRKNNVIRKSDIAISSEKRPIPQEQKPQEPKLRLINFFACKTVGEYNRNKRKIEKLCLAEKAQLTRTGQPIKKAGKEATAERQPSSEPRNRKATADAPGPSSSSLQQGTSTPIDEDESITQATKATLNICPIMTKAQPSPAQKKLKKKSPKVTQKGKRSSIRKKATVPAARKTANMKLTKAKQAALKQSYVLSLSRSPVNTDEMGKKRQPAYSKNIPLGTQSPSLLQHTPPRRTLRFQLPKRAQPQQSPSHPRCATSANLKPKQR